MPMTALNINDAPKNPPSLDEMGSRYLHYCELRDVFADGVVVMNNTLSYHKNAADIKRRDSLQCAVNEINNRLDNLSGIRKCHGLLWISRPTGQCNPSSAAAKDDYGG